MAASTTKPKTNDARAQEMLLWARKNRFAVHGITVGDVTITCADLGPAVKPGRSEPTTTELKSVYAEYGGEAWERANEAMNSGELDDPEDDGDDKDDDDGTPSK